ncbi:hypothetical protein B0181_04110 [Moraxella caviae]|uniref:Uncharacterized protein n=1 Tax=Moraxella caviae TaxID=34060 RepID=A0A1T0A5P8_9GAMM|nr:hypothetical protein B0181_04110 [Moraxella caviae]
MPSLHKIHPAFIKNSLAILNHARLWHKDYKRSLLLLNFIRPHVQACDFVSKFFMMAYIFLKFAENFAKNQRNIYQLFAKLHPKLKNHPKIRPKHTFATLFMRFLCRLWQKFATICNNAKLVWQSHGFKSWFKQHKPDQKTPPNH